MGDKGEEGIKNLKKWVMSFMDGTFSKKKSASFNMFQGHCGTTIDLIISAVCKTKQDATQISKKIYIYIYKGPSINDVIHLG